MYFNTLKIKIKLYFSIKQYRIAEEIFNDYAVICKYKFSIILQKQSSVLFCKEVALENFSNFTEKHLYWSLFLIKLQAWRYLFWRTSCEQLFLILTLLFPRFFWHEIAWDSQVSILSLPNIHIFICIFACEMTIVYFYSHRL